MVCYHLFIDEAPTMLLCTRNADKSTEGLTDWPFMSILQMGENPAGTWTVRIADTVSNLLPNS